MKLDTDRLAAINARVAEEVTRSSARSSSWRARSSHRLAPAARGDPVRQARPHREAPRQDRVLHRCARARGDPRGAPDHPQDRALAGADASSRSTYLDALPALIDPATGRLHTTFSQTSTATGRLSATNPNLQNIPIRTPLGRRDPQLLRRRPRAPAARDRLLPGGAARPGPHRRRGRAEGDLPSAARTSTPRPRARSSSVEPDRSRRGAVEGENGQLRDRLRPQRHGLSEQLQIEREEADEFIDRYLSASRPCGSSSTDTIADATDRGLRADAVRAPPPDPRAARPPVSGCAQLGERLAVNTVIQGTAADIIKVAMVRCGRRSPTPVSATRLVLQIHDELLFEGPPEEARARPRHRLGRDDRRVRARPATGRRRRHRRLVAGREVTIPPALR